MFLRNYLNLFKFIMGQNRGLKKMFPGSSDSNRGQKKTQGSC